MTTTTFDAGRPGRLSDELFHRCLMVSSTVGVLFLIVVWIAPAQRKAITQVEQLPARFARLILEKPVPKPSPPIPRAGTPDKPVGPAAVEQPRPERPLPPPPSRRPDAAPRLDPNRGQAGRERAREVVASSLRESQASLEQTLSGLSSSLRTAGSEAPRPGPGRRARGVRGGRSERELGTVAAEVSGGGGADLDRSVVAGTQVSIGALGGVPGGTGDGVAGGGGGRPDGDASGSGSAPGVYRSNASLLAVIQKYAAGIQYCYGNELKRQPGLRGKLVVAITVAASGDVTEATVVQNTLGSERLASCALSQIRAWKFPRIAEGVTAFQAPFVFTPPE
jgi:TonB family protein